MPKRLTAPFAKGQDRGFTLIELLLVILIIGVLAAVGGPLYIEYTRDAKLGEGKALAGSVLTIFRVCAQTDPTGATCGLANLATKVGLTNSGDTGDGRWHVTTDNVTFTGSAATGNGGLILVQGNGTDNANMSAAIVIDAKGGVHLFCNTAGTGPGTTPC